MKAFTLATLAFLIFAVSCGGEDTTVPPPSAGESPNTSSIGLFDMSCGQPQQKQQVQSLFQQQPVDSCSSQLVFADSTVAEWNVDLDCNNRLVHIESTGADRATVNLPIGPNGAVAGKMNFQQQVQSDASGNAACWVGYVVSFDGVANCTTGAQSINLNTLTEFQAADPEQIPPGAAGMSQNLSTPTQEQVNISVGAKDRGSQAFGANPLQVAVGSTVTWTNNDTIPHTVTANDGAFDSGEIPPGGQFTHTFDQAGSFPYHCEIHPGMRGRVLVTPASPVPGTSPSASPSASASPSTSPSVSPSASVTPSSTPSSSPSATPVPVPVPVPVCVIQQPCPLKGTIAYTCP